MYADLRMMEWVFGADVPALAKLVLFAMIYHANKKKKRLSYPTQETIGAKVGLTRKTVGKMLETLTAKGLIERVKSSGRSVHYRLTYYEPDPSPPQSQIDSVVDGKAQDMRMEGTADGNDGHSRCERGSHLMGTTFSSDGNDVPTNKRNNLKQITKAPTKEENRPPAIQPTVFKQSGMVEGECNVADGEWERMFEEFWAAYPERCPRKVDKAKCRQKYAAILAESSDPSKRHAKMLDSLKKWDASELWNKEGGRFIRAPYAWLDKCSWEDSPLPDKALAAKKAAASRTYDWSLCAERCANCGGDRCGVGVKVPPDYGEWASPPEECEHFRAAS